MGAIIPQVITEDRAGASIGIDGSLRFDSSKSHYLTRTPTSVGNRKTWTWSGWVKRSALSGLNESYIFNAGFSTDDSRLRFDSSDFLSFVLYQGAATVAALTSASVYRDFSSWYHITLVVDTPQSVSTDRVKIYVNGSQLILSGTYPTQNLDTSFNTAQPHTIASRALGGSYFFNGQLTNVYFIDGQALTPSYFGYTDPLTNTWRPKRFKPQATPNNGTTWSSAGNFSGDVRSQGDTYGPPKMFNGIIGNESTTDAICFAPYTSNSFCTWTSPATLTGLTSLRLYVDLSGTTGRLTVNGVDYSSLVTALSGGDGWISIPQSSLSTIGFGYTGGLVSATGIGAVEVNGVILLDGDTTNIGKNGFYLPFDGNSPIGQDLSGNVGIAWTAVNFGGSNTIEKATGALPILNTDGGGKVARVGVRTDSNASSLVLALPLVGIASDVSNMINSGSTQKTTTVTSGVSSSAQSIFYGGSYYFDGNNDYITVTNSSDFNYTTSQSFTVEMWLYGMNSGRNFPVGSTAYNNGTVDYSGGIRIDWSPGTNFIFQVGTGFVTGTNVTTNTWHHIAYVYDAVAQTTKLYVDGVQNGSTTSGTQSLTNAGNLLLGVQGSDLILDYQGYIQDFRIYKGVAKYTKNFIPASTDPDILPDTPSGVAYSSNVALVPSTDGAVAFDGSGDYLQTAASGTNFTVGGAAFSIECYAYFNDFSSTPAIFSAGSGGVSAVVSSTGYLTLYRNGAGGYANSLSTNQLSTGRWYHLAWVTSDGSQWYGYVNGVQGTFTAGWTGEATTTPGYVGTYGNSVGTQSPNAFISNLHVVKGTALYTSNFTPPTVGITTVANTKLLCCKSQTSATAFDVSPGIITAFGNVAASNFNPFTENINTQRGQESGYCTWNPLAGNTYSASYKNGNLTFDTNGIAADGLHVFSTYQLPTSGKWYWETTFSLGVGFPGINSNITKGDNTQLSTMKVYNSNGEIGGVAGSSTWTTGDVIGMAYDADAGTLRFYKNGILQPTSISSVGSSSGPWWAQVRQDRTATCDTTFGQKPFKFPPPAGFQPLALANTPRPTIVRPDQYVGIVTYQGTGSSLTTSFGFTPDFVWVKNRSAAHQHRLFDSVRGDNNIISSNAVNIEQNISNSLSIVRNGFTVGTSTVANTNGNGYVAWGWRAGGQIGVGRSFMIDNVGFATAGNAGMNAGTIIPSGASVNTKSGFSIITYTGNGNASATISHGLTSAPSFIILKRRDAAVNWFVYARVLGNGVIEGLNTTAAYNSVGGTFALTAPSSSVFTVGGTDGNNNTSTYVAYLWAEIPGFSKFGSYTGNGSSDGPVIVTGFRPRWVMVKRTDSTSDWIIYDTDRDAYNVMGKALYPSLSNAEADSPPRIDFLSNGFKARISGASEPNWTGGTVIYAAFAEAPSFNLYGGQANAR